jgi:hypothetical protein
MGSVIASPAAKRVTCAEIIGDGLHPALSLLRREIWTRSIRGPSMAVISY